MKVHFPLLHPVHQSAADWFEARTFDRFFQSISKEFTLCSISQAQNLLFIDYSEKSLYTLLEK